MLSLLEVAPRSAFLPLLLTAGETWLKAFASHTLFWVDNSIGRRLCALYGKIVSDDRAAIAPFSVARRRLEAVLPPMIALGVIEANTLEEQLRT